MTDKQADCPKCKGSGHILWHDKQSGAEFVGTDRETLCSNCNGTGKALKHRLDRPDREKIAEWLYLFDTSNDTYSLWSNAAENIKNYYREQADHILVFIPDEEEIRKSFDLEQHRLNAEWTELVKQTREMTLREVEDYIDRDLEWANEENEMLWKNKLQLWRGKP